MPDTTPSMQLLNSDGWRDVSEYVPSRDYVYVKGFAARAPGPWVGIARRGKYSNSYWWQPDGVALPLHIGWWKPFPNDGISPHERCKAFSRPYDGSYVRPPEEVYEPAGVDHRLTPIPMGLLWSMHKGGILHESAWRWTKWTLQTPGTDRVKLPERGINPLRKAAFIERDGVLPPGRLERWYEFDWKVTDAGKAWIEANK